MNDERMIDQKRNQASFFCDFGMLPRCGRQEVFFPFQQVVKSECATFLKDAAGAAQSLVSLWDS